MESRNGMESRDSMRDAQDKSMKGMELAAVEEMKGMDRRGVHLIISVGPQRRNRIKTGERPVWKL